MITDSQYRLMDYQISEYMDGRLWWHAYSGFGTLTGGPCFIYGNILLLGARRKEEDGFLILEFSEKLNKLPLWHKTRYYCFSSALLDVATGRNIREDRLQRLTCLPIETGADQAIISMIPKTYRLQKYLISNTPGGDISWKSYSGENRIVSGSVLVESDILFIGPGKSDDLQQGKREFLYRLQFLPEWDQTTFWCRSLALKSIFLQKDQPPVVPSLSKKNSSQAVLTAVKHHKMKGIKTLWSQVVGNHDDLLKKVKAKWSQKKFG